MVQETAHVLRRIERRILMHRARPRRSAASFADVTVPVVSRKESAGPLLRQLRHQRQDGVGLTDAGCMEPGELPLRPGQARPAEAFVAPRRVFLAASLAQPEQQRRRRARQRCQRAVRLEAQAGLGAAGQCHAGVARDGIGVGALVGQRGGGVQGILDGLPVDLEVVGIGRRAARTPARRWQSRGRTTAGSASCGSSC